MPKLAIVTGASGNMGQAVARKFLEQGYHVAGTIVPNDPIALNISNDRFEKIVVDLLDENATLHFVDTIIQKYGTIDTLVCTVGGFAVGKIADTSAASISQQMSLNFYTAFHIVKPVFGKMILQGQGRIFLVGSRPGLDAANGKGMLAYGLSKSLIFRLAEWMNTEAAGTNVVTSVLVPSTIDTPQNRKSMPTADFGSWVTPEAIAEAVYFYSSEQAAALREPLIKLYNKA